MPHDLPFAPLFATYMRHKGVHLWDGRPAMVTTAHSAGDLDFVAGAFREVVAEMQESGFLPGLTPAPPLPGARLGKDQAGRDAWFVPDPERPGKYLQVM
jgi:hypothetical protein